MWIRFRLVPVEADSTTKPETPPELDLTILIFSFQKLVISDWSYRPEKSVVSATILLSIILCSLIFFIE